ncbi:MAG: septum site-determining protein MinC [Lachnospiraceae bacterium]|nr:septum site-determining protein MinC [Lachnospiraceae bacterium]
MKNAVMIKGATYGVVVVLNPEVPFEELKKEVGDKFRESSRFFGNAQMAVSFEGRSLTNDQQEEVIETIMANSDLSIVCVMEKNPELDEQFKKAIDERMMELNNATGQFYKGNLRSGQVLETETSIVVIGDVNPGASVVSKGNIVILGSLKGTVFAGASGNTNSFVLALDMNPVQIRIADTIARCPDKPAKEESKEPKVAFLENGNIYIEPLGRKVLNDIRL